MDTKNPITDPRTLLDALDPEEIRRELSEAIARAKALKVLLRASLDRRPKSNRKAVADAR